MKGSSLLTKAVIILLLSSSVPVFAATAQPSSKDVDNFVNDVFKDASKRNIYDGGAYKVDSQDNCTTKSSSSDLSKIDISPSKKTITINPPGTVQPVDNDVTIPSTSGKLPICSNSCSGSNSGNKLSDKKKAELSKQVDSAISNITNPDNPFSAINLSGNVIKGQADKAKVKEVLGDISSLQDQKSDNSDNQSQCNANNTKKATKNEPKTLTVKKGDSLWKMAERIYGDGSKFKDIIEANKDKYPSLIKNPDLIYPGWKLTIPEDKDKKQDGQNSPNSNAGSSADKTKSVIADNSSNNSSNSSEDSSTTPSKKVSENPKSGKSADSLPKIPQFTTTQKKAKLQKAVNALQRTLIGQHKVLTKLDSKTIRQMIDRGYMSETDWMAMNPPEGYIWGLSKGKVVLIPTKSGKKTLPSQTAQANNTNNQTSDNSTKSSSNIIASSNANSSSQKAKTETERTSASNIDSVIPPAPPKTAENTTESSCSYTTPNSTYKSHTTVTKTDKGTWTTTVTEETIDNTGKYLNKNNSKQQAAKEQAAKEQAAKEQAAKEQAAKEQAAKEQAAKEQAAKEQAAKEQAAKEQAAKEQAAKNQAKKEIQQTANEHFNKTIKDMGMKVLFKNRDYYKAIRAGSKFMSKGFFGGTTPFYKFVNNLDYPQYDIAQLQESLYSAQLSYEKAVKNKKTKRFLGIFGDTIESAGDRVAERQRKLAAAWKELKKALKAADKKAEEYSHQLMANKKLAEIYQKRLDSIDQYDSANSDEVQMFTKKLQDTKDNIKKIEEKLEQYKKLKKVFD